MALGLTHLYQKLKYRIVSIEAIKDHELSAEPYFGLREQGTERRISFGSGMIIHPRGYVLTCHHVVEGSKWIRIKWGRKQHILQGEIISTDPEQDMAVLKITPVQKFTPVLFAKPGSISVGDRVFAIGNPFGFEHTLTQGVLSGTRRTITTQHHEYTNVLQTDAALNPGNSGGPLFNGRGKVIGMNAVIIQSYQNVGFAIPLQTFRPFIKKYLPKK